ncbi:plasmid stabilization protein [Brevundimonas naejangsanensis]|uniref:plasmid stabilization protein n=1 Tax=Brevundimonas naejangsanensis TaxID=588932 RepID=UPI001968C542|nr:plasmid stabilization protein [Brevundimonas naejangsanensis]
MSTDRAKRGLSRRGVLTAAALAALAPALPARAGGRSHVIVVDKMAFGAAPMGIKVGDTVTWTNRDIVRHTATARNGAFNVDLPPGASASAVMNRAGTIAYYCRFHPAMQAQISVSA